ncbi:hypothetical protein COCC4DRAFT_198182 [Bipolaris maydis ATCC 48331]|uniref:Uncharacterized protein n=2 Tax=Cochliobolus heterostrophus TaxID=5016 RepID=M2UEZ7_COCH5|nr:uncharacterized protein COCC4DRAFT_198182 [Bipolaris maydis ATCC 48331]EMD97094.1 hypothetical protein COCHEDRAFT_1190012 [Bipolaris maydis C5]ENI04440.1 hypothetical protein COCC4DRAFT_198182 [Bipolaris maydis ATCC 48331]KAJ6214669.1 hypothetical protein PSV09DRAFT_1190012 [Bipolaris maydis]
MFLHHYCILLLTLLTTLSLASSTTSSPFPCTGGSIYFTAHTVDSLLFQNPDVLHDLFVFKCVITVVFNADTGGEARNETRREELEYGLGRAYEIMSSASLRGSGGSVRNNTKIPLYKYDVAASPLLGLSNVQILFLRLPDSTYYGQGYRACREESLKMLYSAEISRITATDRAATYTIRDLKEIIATILRERRADDIHVLNYLASLSTGQDDYQLEHADRIMSAKLVMDVVKEEGIEGRVVAHGCDEVRNQGVNLNTPDYINKVNAFFEYAKYDPDMCQSVDECGERLSKAGTSIGGYNEGDYIYEFLKREYYVT